MMVDANLLTLLIQSTSAILMENMDLYMLNPCSNKIWWVHWRTTGIQLTGMEEWSLMLASFLWIYFLINLLYLPLSRFVIELCEPIQVKQLDIANFELFSSTPKDFLVSISDRYTLFLVCLSGLVDWLIGLFLWWFCDSQKALHWTMWRPPVQFFCCVLHSALLLAFWFLTE